MNESVWLDPRAPGAALPGRKVMTLVHGMITGADSVGQAGSTGLILGHRVMAPSTLGTFLRAFTFGTSASSTTSSMSACASRRLAWFGDGPLVIDLDSFIGEVYGYEKQAPHTGTPASGGITRSSPPVPIPRSAAHPQPQGKANTQRGAERFVDELLARVRRAGTTADRDPADSGFENHKIMRTLDHQGVEFSIGVEQSKQVKTLIEEIPETDWSWCRTIPRPGRHKSPRPRSVTGGWSCAAPACSARRQSYGPTGATTAS